METFTLKTTPHFLAREKSVSKHHSKLRKLLLILYGIMTKQVLLYSTMSDDTVFIFGFYMMRALIVKQRICVQTLRTLRKTPLLYTERTMEEAILTFIHVISTVLLYINMHSL